MAERQSQKAGTNSTQLQVQGDLHVHQGVTEERAVAIAKEQAEIAVRDYAAEASEVGAARIESFNERLVPKLDEQATLDAFRDPGFQLLLRKAQLGAAASGRDADYDMLVSLLADRAERGENRKVSASIDRAVEVIDKLADDALAGLTVVQAFVQYVPTSVLMAPGLDALERLFAQLELDDLPSGDEWIDHLDTLNLVRVSRMQTRTPAAQFWNHRLPGYVSVGVPKEEAEEAGKRHEAACPEIQLLYIEHEHKPEWVRALPIKSNAFRREYQAAGFSPDAIERYEKSLIENFKADEVDPTLMTTLHEAAAERPSLNIIQTWWDAIPAYFDVTGIGRVVARANADRLDVNNLLPPLD